MSIQLLKAAEALSEERQARLEAAASFRESYRILGQSFELRADGPLVLERFRKMYGRFLVDEKPSSSAAFYLVQGDEPFGGCALVEEGLVHLVRDPEVFLGYAFMRLIRSFLRRIRSHWIFHAAALSKGGQGVVLAGHENRGKTTLALELVRRGYAFLSDDMACVERHHHRLDPFPRALSLDDHSLAFFRGMKAQRSDVFVMPDGQHKRIIDIEDFSGGSLGSSCPGRFLFVLNGARSKVGEGTRRFSISFCSPISEGFLSALKKIPGVCDVSVKESSHYPAVAVRAHRRARVAESIARLCRQFDLQVFASTWGREEPADFRREPVLTRLSVANAALALIPHLVAGPPPHVNGVSLHENVCRTLFDVSGVVSEMECHLLSTGYLGATADLIDGVVASKQKGSRG